jgi:hypothetical protein
MDDGFQQGRFQRSLVRKKRSPGAKAKGTRPIIVAAETESRSRCTLLSLPLMRSSQPGSLLLDNAKIFRLIEFPEEHGVTARS